MNLRQARKSVGKTKAQAGRLRREIRISIIHDHAFRRSVRMFVVDTPQYEERLARQERAYLELSRRARRALRRHKVGTPGAGYGVELAHAALNRGR